MEPLISVIIPIYKVEEYLNECVESVINQTYKNLEIILVDDGSPDNCPQICDDWAKRDNRIKVIHKQNGGLSSARNAGLDICTGDYIGFIDSDDWVDVKFYETLYNNLIKNHADISRIGVCKVFKDHKLESQLPETIFTGEQALHDFLYFKNGLAGGTWDKLFPKKLFTELRFPLGLNEEDRYTHAVLYSKIDRLHFDPRPMYFYRVRENSICTSSDFNEHTFDRIKVTEKVCNYLEDIGYSDNTALDYFKMKGFHDVLYRLLIINAPKKYIKEYKKKTRKYFWKTIRNKEVSLLFKLKYICFCFIPITYERMKKIFYMMKLKGKNEYHR